MRSAVVQDVEMTRLLSVPIRDDRRSVNDSKRRRYLETVEPRPWLSRPMLGVLLIAVGFNVVEMLKPRSRPTVDGLQKVVVSNVVDGCRSPLCRHLKRLHRSVVMLILIYVSRRLETNFDGLGLRIGLESSCLVLALGFEAYGPGLVLECSSLGLYVSSLGLKKH